MKSGYRVLRTNGKLVAESAICFTQGCDWFTSYDVIAEARKHVRETGHDVTVDTERAVHYYADSTVPPS